jgi:hypothetical protein
MHLPIGTSPCKRPALPYRFHASSSAVQLGTVLVISRSRIGSASKGMSPMRHNVAFLATMAFLAGCGTSQPERTSGGAAAGAATGAGVGALGGPPGMAVGALVGAGAGAATGAATKPSDVNLGKPPWTNPETRVPGSGQPSRTASRTRGSGSESATVDELNNRSLDAARQGSSFNP